MKRTNALQAELAQTQVIEDLTEVFESIASIHIAKIHSRVVTSKEFFSELWQTYAGLRVDPRERLMRSHVTKGRNVLVAVTDETKLAGSTDEQVVRAMLQAYTKPQTTDIIVVGTHGAYLMHAFEVATSTPFATYPMPVSDTNFNIDDLVAALNEYDQISVFYQTYESLLVQRVVRIELISTVRSLGADVSDDEETVSSHDYIFEPSINEIADYLESVMIGVAIIQIIMESKLAHYANRFNSMSAAKKRATDMVKVLRSRYYRSRRSESDERLKEIMRTTRKLASEAAAS